ncbi:hypothetical protein B0O99DRAFT_54545 [Bisporella sp. PMI_857]|nr:hypothetical protein B0O99DRAFT_54545 [Bisporella sp. PMI_857]
MKAEQPGWIIEGLDDNDAWSRIYPGYIPKDFMKECGKPKDSGDYFSRVPSSQNTYPEFTIRNINCILDHENPIPNNLYDLVRGRDIFDKVYNYKTFLDSVRLILKPDGVVEFTEIDPRPRFAAVRPRLPSTVDHLSRAATTWTDNIDDRFKGGEDSDIATLVPGWTTRVAERLKSRLRPSEEVAAPKLKSWLQGAGFWDVKQSITHLSVGGKTRTEHNLRDFVVWQAELEDSIPELKEVLPSIEVDEISSGKYYVNLYIVTGRKPLEPRAGHLLLDGSRQEMTESKYSAMARAFDGHDKSNHWQRLSSQTDLAKMMDGLSIYTKSEPPFSPSSLVESQIASPLELAEKGHVS